MLGWTVPFPPENDTVSALRCFTYRRARAFPAEQGSLGKRRGKPLSYGPASCCSNDLALLNPLKPRAKPFVYNSTYKRGRNVISQRRVTMRHPKKNTVPQTSPFLRGGGERKTLSGGDGNETFIHRALVTGVVEGRGCFNRFFRRRSADPRSLRGRRLGKRTDPSALTADAAAAEPPSNRESLTL